MSRRDKVHTYERNKVFTYIGSSSPWYPAACGTPIAVGPIKLATQSTVTCKKCLKARKGKKYEDENCFSG